MLTFMFTERVGPVDVLGHISSLCHASLGPMVRLAPREISANSPEAVGLIYSKGWEKDRFYGDIFTVYESVKRMSWPSLGPRS